MIEKHHIGESNMIWKREKNKSNKEKLKKLKKKGLSRKEVEEIFENNRKVDIKKLQK